MDPRITDSQDEYVKELESELADITERFTNYKDNSTRILWYYIDKYQELRDEYDTSRS